MDQRSRNSGFSIIEVMIAIAILMIGLVSIISLQVSGIHWLAQAKHKTVAVQVATEMIEFLKTVPVDRDDSSHIMVDTNSVQLRDMDGHAILWDSVVADGYNTWHRLPPMTANGDFCMCANQTCSNWVSACSYLVAYGVEWGGSNRSPWIAQSGTGNQIAQFPMILPGAFEIYIEVWIGWVEAGDRERLSGTTPPSVLDYYRSMNSTFPLYPAVFPKHKVVLRTIRRLPLPH
jgi:prepilin-type N-terminal cleavage/methylation domain-containing protein